MIEVRPINERVIELATLGDAAWFESNADRRIRIRNAVPMEFNAVTSQLPAGMTLHTLVLEAQRGVRMRQPVALSAEVAIDELGDDELFALFMQAAPIEAKDALKKLRSTKLSGIPNPVASR
ncbi:MAG: hypothetical protein P0Y59_00410 [Candidatus Sphingomonas phytovorans]|nr:hypothetical protein [Sphingomonas sp.]WEK00198.1 MAG: hypothetical protein P0Y59_00410 [Sphingomonas sp.]